MQLACHDPRHVEQVVDEPNLGARVAFDDLQSRSDFLRIVHFTGNERAAPAENGVQRRP